MSTTDTLATLANATRTPAWGALNKPLFGKETEVLAPTSTAAHIVAATEETPPYVYSSHLVRYATKTANGVVSGCLTPNQVVPIWELHKEGNLREWSLTTAVKHLMYSAVGYQGKLYAGNSIRPDQQVFDPAKFQDGAETVLDGKRLMLPGGRYEHSLQTEFPWATPLKNHPAFTQKVRTAFPMTLGKWTSLFGHSEVVTGTSRPSLALVAYSNDGPEELWDPILNDIVAAITLEIPVSMEYVESVMSIRGLAAKELFLNIEMSVMDYLEKNHGDALRVGLAWKGDLTSGGEPLGCDWVEENPTTAGVTFIEELDPDDKEQVLRMGGSDQLTSFMTGEYVQV